MTPVHKSRTCCDTPSIESSLERRLLYLLEKTSAVALGVFSAYASIELFLSFFLVGSAIGIYQSFSSDDPERKAGRRVSTCSQGLLEQLTDTKLPPIASLFANLAVTWCHIEHHTAIFVPIVGVSLGAWAGQTIGSSM